MLIYVSSPGGLLSIDVEPSDSIGAIKSKVYVQNSAYPINQQVLTFNGTILDDTQTISNYGIQKNNTVTLTIQAQTTCFLADAPVLTSTGYVRIADIAVGDLIISGDGAYPVQRIVRKRVYPCRAVNPFIIPKGMYGATQRLLISPRHKINTGTAMVEAKDCGLQQEKMSVPFVYYNLELLEYKPMTVAGVTVESLAPIRRITVTKAIFYALIKQTYGEMTPALKQKIRASVAFLPDGRVNMPVLYNR